MYKNINKKKFIQNNNKEFQPDKITIADCFR